MQSIINPAGMCYVHCYQ